MIGSFGTSKVAISNACEKERKSRLLDFVREVWNDGREEFVERYIAPTYTIHHDPGDPWEGEILDVDGYKRRLRTLRRSFPDQRFEIQQLYTNEGESALLTWLWSASHLADLPGFRATGAVIHTSGATAFYFAPCGRVCGHWQMSDRYGVVRQLQRHSRSG